MNLRCNTYAAPTGPLLVAVDEQGRLARLSFLREDAETTAVVGMTHDPAATRAVEEQLTAYFAGQRKEFDIPLAPQGTEFQQRVWELLRAIPYGETRSYGQLAAQLGKPGASRAVGRANATNPVAIVVPCHRVIGGNGTLTGFAGGLTMKSRLLDLEQGRLLGE